MREPQDSILLQQARRVLHTRYGFTAAIEQQLQQLVLETQDAAASALAVRHRCQHADVDPADCLLLLEVVALELARLGARLTRS